MYAFTPGQPLCPVYEVFYLAIVNIFYGFIKYDELVKSQLWMAKKKVQGQGATNPEE
jgi:hypothetical protein